MSKEKLTLEQLEALSALGRQRQMELLAAMSEGKNEEEISSLRNEMMQSFRQAADGGYTPAQFELGALYHEGDLVKKNAEEAAIWYKKAADQEYPEAQQNLEKVLSFLKSDVVQGSVPAQPSLKSERKNKGVTPEYAEDLCNRGDSYYSAKEGDQAENKKLAKREYSLAVNEGSARGQYSFGKLIYENMLRNEDSRWFPEGDFDGSLVFSLFLSSAEQGYPHAQHALGKLYLNGIAVEKNEQKAVEYFRLAADQELAPAQCSLGICYFNGTGVGKDEAEAVKYLGLAAEQGYAPGQHALGKLYLNGTGVGKDEAEAASCFRPAAEQGYASAQYSLGRLYFGGKGVEKNSTQAILWLARASASFEPAKGILNKKMLPNENYFVSVERNQNNSALSASEIIEVISASALQGRVANSKSNLIGNLVEVSESLLSSEELLKIYSTLAKTGGVDVKNSESCKKIANSWAKKLGQEIGLGEEGLRKIKVLIRDADRVSCQLPSGIVAKSASESSLGGGEELLERRKGQLRSKAGITGCEPDSKTGNFLIVMADAKELPAILPNAALPTIYRTPEEFFESNPILGTSSSKAPAPSPAPAPLHHNPLAASVRSRP